MARSKWASMAQLARAVALASATGEHGPALERFAIVRAQLKTLKAKLDAPPAAVWKFAYPWFVGFCMQCAMRLAPRAPRVYATGHGSLCTRCARRLSAGNSAIADALPVLEMPEPPTADEIDWILEDTEARRRTRRPPAMTGDGK